MLTTTKKEKTSWVQATVSGDEQCISQLLIRYTHMCRKIKKKLNKRVEGDGEGLLLARGSGRVQPERGHRAGKVGVGGERCRPVVLQATGITSSSVSVVASRG